jgi:hypothetical protein
VAAARASRARGTAAGLTGSRARGSVLLGDRRRLGVWAWAMRGGTAVPYRGRTRARARVWLEVRDDPDARLSATEEGGERAAGMRAD